MLRVFKSLIEKKLYTSLKRTQYMKYLHYLPITLSIILMTALLASAQEKGPDRLQNQGDGETVSQLEKESTVRKKVVETVPVDGTQETDKKGIQPDEIVKEDLGGEEIYFDVTSLNLFNYGLAFFFGFDENTYGFSGMLGYRHCNTFRGFPGSKGGTCVALDIFVEAGATIASLDGENTVGGFISLLVAPNILWFKPLSEGNFDRTGNGIFIGAKVQGDINDDGFEVAYGPAIGWTTLYYNTEKKKFRATNITLFFYPPTLLLGISATTSF